jgi:hypothetical protein
VTIAVVLGNWTGRRRVTVVKVVAEFDDCDAHNTCGGYSQRASHARNRAPLRRSETRNRRNRSGLIQRAGAAMRRWPSQPGCDARPKRRRPRGSSWRRQGDLWGQPRDVGAASAWRGARNRGSLGRSCRRRVPGPAPRGSPSAGRTLPAAEPRSACAGEGTRPCVRQGRETKSIAPWGRGKPGGGESSCEGLRPRTAWVL